MSDLRNKILGLAGFALACAGMASAAPSTCTQGTVYTNIIRGEGTTELVATPPPPPAAQPTVGAAYAVSSGDTITCTAGAGGSITMQVFVSAPVTSKVLNTTSGATEAVAVVVDNTTGFVVAQTGGAAFVEGTVSGGTINFSTITLPAADPSTIYIQNVRVNASTVTVGSGSPPPITESVFISGAAAIVNTAALVPANVAFVENSLTSKAYAGLLAGAVSPFTGGVNFVVCNAISPSASGAAALSTVLQVTDGFPTADKTLADEASAVTIAAAAPAVANTVNSGTRFSITFANIPAGLTLYLPLTVTGNNGAVLTMTTSATGAFTAATATTPSLFNGLFGFTEPAPFTPPGNGSSSNSMVAVTGTGGAATVVYEVTTDTLTSLETYNIPVYAFFAANAIAPTTTGISETVSYAPTGSTNVPNFAANTTALTGTLFSVCQTSLLFPFVTNQSGFDTGIVLANTSTDNLGVAGKSLVTAQAGTCSLYFYGAGAPTTQPVAAPGGSQASGTTNAFTLSSVAPGFQGYMIANCAFQYGHGYGFLTNGATAGNAAVAQGYIAEVFNSATRAAPATGTGEATTF